MFFSVGEIFEKLKQEGSDWSLKTLDTMSKFSPRSLKLSHRQLLVGKELSLADVLTMEYRLAVGCCEYDNDFIEGVRALLVNKDNAPQWSPPSVEEVPDSFIDTFFKVVDNDLNVVEERKKLKQTV